MKALKYCIRCNSLRDGEKRFSNNEIASIYLCNQLLMMELDIQKDVCPDCREKIGDESANQLLEGGSG